MEDKQLEFSTNEVIKSFCPFGYLDMMCATRAALEADKTTDFVYECVEEFATSCDMPIDKCDPCYCVYDTILQEARNELCDLISYDFINDCLSGEIYTAGNFMATSYDYPQMAIDELILRLQEHNVIIEDLTKTTQWFLSQINITQESIENND